MESKTAMIFNIQRFSTEDGPGIRTTVFFKGCPLRCIWCCNPESQNKLPELSHRATLCVKCGKCVNFCPVGAISLTSKKLSINRSLCNNCGKCVEACSYGVFKMMGTLMTMEEVLKEATRDIDFYKESGGGVTASGGEPLMQGDFVASFFKQCQKLGIHTAMETCGYADTEVLKIVLKFTNLVYFDLKLMDPKLSRQYVGVSNKIILSNARVAAASSVPLIFRVPLIPGVNDFEQNIKDIAGFVNSLERKVPVEILTFHRLGSSKYESLDRKYKLREQTAPGDDYAHKIQNSLIALGVDCRYAH
jgi:pyruvate formate lyase activating enzyme